MAQIRSKDTKPELALRHALHARGFRYRLHDRKLPGRPDLVFRRFGAVCFVHGCFWHRHDGCASSTMPSTRVDYWRDKFENNVNRDQTSRVALLDAGWRVAVVWECALRKQRVDDTIAQVEDWLLGKETYYESVIEQQ